MEGLSKFVSKSFEQCIKSSDRVQEFLNTMTQQTRLPSKLLIAESNQVPADLSLNNETHINSSNSCNHNSASCQNGENRESEESEENEKGSVKNVVEDSDNNSDTIDIDITDVSDLTRTPECEMPLNSRDVNNLQPLSLVKHNNTNNDNMKNTTQYNSMEEEQYSSGSNGSHQNESMSPPILITNMSNDALVINTVIQCKDTLNGSHKTSPIGSATNCSTKTTKNWLVSDSSKENHFERSNLINVDGKDVIRIDHSQS